MKKVSLFIILTLMIIGFSSISTTLNIYGNSKLVENISDFKVYLRNVLIDEETVEIIEDSSFSVENINGNITYEIVNDSTEYDAEVYLECNGTKEEETEWNFDYTGSEQTFNVPTSGTYKLETWGASGGDAIDYIGGKGGYSVGQIDLTKGYNLYINVGSVGNIDKVVDNGYLAGGYNGGGASYVTGTFSASEKYQVGSGGGATHIGTIPGLLYTLNDHINNILIVSGGGGGAMQYYAYSPYMSYGNGGDGGGFYGNPTSNGYYWKTGYQNVIGATQSLASGLTSSQKAGTFGQGANGDATGIFIGGGGGFYGGNSQYVIGGSGGSGYIGNSLLTEKSMCCYNCTESSEESTKTISTTCASSSPTENCSKIGNGYARITLLESNELLSTEKTIIEAQDFYSSNIEKNDYKSLTCNLKVSKISRTSKKDISIK